MKRTLFILILLFPLTVLGEVYGDLIVSRLVRVIDGDTFVVDMDYLHPIIGKNMRIRIKGVDTPEIRDSKCDDEKSLGLEAKAFSKGRLESGKAILLLNIERDQWFRIVADVMIDGVDLGAQILESGYGRKYVSGKRLGWCN